MDSAAAVAGAGAVAAADAVASADDVAGAAGAVADEGAVAGEGGGSAVAWVDLGGTLSHCSAFGDARVSHNDLISKLALTIANQVRTNFRL